ncbi:MAG TPA: M17 family peptidase N-terminal domain-containing protein, partial [Acidobacteriota bacterium]|nr:M17 family peptidase N-terminal domain-containing protein [Acidobacteriota bacterium]
MARLRIHAKPIATLKSDGIGILIAEENQFTPSGSQIDGLYRGQIAKTLRAEAFRVKPRTVLVYYPSGSGFRKVLCTAIPGRVRTTSTLREAAYECAKSAARLGIRKLTLAFDPANALEVQAIGEGALLATYSYDEFKSKKEKKRRIADILVCSAEGDAQPLRRAEAHFRAAQLVR